MNEPLAQRLRPKTLADVCGQQHLLAPGRVFRRTIESGRIPNMIFYGPSGTEKTTVARIIAENSGMTLHKLNGTSAAPGYQGSAQGYRHAGSGGRHSAVSGRDPVPEQKAAAEPVGMYRGRQRHPDRSTTENPISTSITRCFPAARCLSSSPLPQRTWSAECATPCSAFPKGNRCRYAWTRTPAPIWPKAPGAICARRWLSGLCGHGSAGGKRLSNIKTNQITVLTPLLQVALNVISPTTPTIYFNPIPIFHSLPLPHPKVLLHSFFLHPTSISSII